MAEGRLGKPLLASASTFRLAMQQTLLSVFGLALVVVLALNTTRDGVDRQTRTIRGELTSQARGVAGEVLGHIGRYRFDGSAGTTPAGFTPEASFGPPGRAFGDPAIADIDDFHRAAPHVVQRAVYNPQARRDEVLAYTVTVAVRYLVVSATAATPSGGVATYDKEVTVTVLHPRMTAPVTLSRVFSYGA